VVLAIGALGLAACGPPAPPAPTAAPLEDDRFLVGTYEGTLPCEDCAGVRTRVALYTMHPHDLTDPTYAMSETRLGTRDGARRVRSAGRWSREQTAIGMLYVLAPGSGAAPRHFLVIGTGQLEELDDRRERRAAATGYVLGRDDTVAPAP